MKSDRNSLWNFSRFVMHKISIDWLNIPQKQVHNSLHFYNSEKAYRHLHSAAVLRLIPVTIILLQAHSHYWYLLIDSDLQLAPFLSACLALYTTTFWSPFHMLLVDQVKLRHWCTLQWWRAWLAITSFFSYFLQFPTSNALYHYAVFRI